MKKNITMALLISCLLVGCSQLPTDTNTNVTVTDSKEQNEDNDVHINQEELIETSEEEDIQTPIETGDYMTGLAPQWRENKKNIIDDKYRTYYEVFVYSYCDSDGDGIGDINGLRSKLDYLNDGDDNTDSDLGVTGLWLMPIMPSPSYHKYDTTDYLSVDPEYGTVDDMKALLEECHQRGINVIIDLAMNHSSSEHPWFKEAYEYLQSLKPGQEPKTSQCKYLDYYHFTREKNGGFSIVTDTDWYYESRFNYDMPDLNLQNPEVRKEFEDIAEYWLKLGVDGFRLDAVKYYDTGRDDLNIETLTWFNDYVKGINPNAYIVCENWSEQSEYCSYYSSGVDSMFDFAFADKSGRIAKTMNKTSSASSYGKALEAEDELYQRYSDDYINAPFYTNHDMGRSAGYYAGDNAYSQTKMAQALNLMMSGNTFIYYGEELGMKGAGKDENKRAPMYWSDESNEAGMCEGPQDMDDVTMIYDCLEVQVDDEESIYNYVKDCILLRNQLPAIARGKNIFVESCSNDDVCVVAKEYGEDSLYILFNISENKNTVDLTAISTDNLNVCGELYASDSNVNREGNRFDMPPYSIIVLNKADNSYATDNEDIEKEYVTGYATEQEFRKRHVGSASYIWDRTIVYSIFVNEEEDVWTQNEKDYMLRTCTIAYDFLKKELKDKYDTDVDLVYDWKVNPDLSHEVRIFEEIPAYVTSKEESHIDELEDGWIADLDISSLLQKYEAQSIAFLYFIPHEGCSYSSMHFLADGPETWNEGCLLYLEDMYSPTFEYETPTVFAHELLHLFGAEDYYPSAEVFSKQTYSTLASICENDLMYQTFATIDGVYTTFPDEVYNEITPVTAYLLGIYDESAVDEVPELVKEETGCFSGSAKDRPF